MLIISITAAFTRCYIYSYIKHDIAENLAIRTLMCLIAPFIIITRAKSRNYRIRLPVAFLSAIREILFVKSLSLIVELLEVLRLKL